VVNDRTDASFLGHLSDAEDSLDGLFSSTRKVGVVRVAASPSVYGIQLNSNSKMRSVSKEWCEFIETDGLSSCAVQR